MNETLTYNSIRQSRIAQESTKKLKTTRKRNILVLVWNFLQEMGYLDTSKTFEEEVNLDFGQYAVCDNIDLETILQDFESFYYVRFQKYPQIVKKIIEDDTNPHNPIPALKTKSLSKQTNGNQERIKRKSYSCVPVFTANPVKKNDENGTSCMNSPKTAGNLSLDGQQIQYGLNNKQTKNELENAKDTLVKQTLSYDDTTILKSLNLFAEDCDEWKELAEVISRDIYQTKLNVKWNDIIGLDEAKRVIKEAVVYPLRYPQLFSGILSPWKALLLYGPPGTGKTLLAKAVATECNTTFFNISASTVVSKRRGDSEKLIRILFDLARFHSPSTIFIDELDALMRQRNISTVHCEHEASRRMKTELLVQLDGLARSNDLVFFLAATNLPWDVDHAMLRRLDKRIFVDVPNENARESMFKNFLPPTVQSKDGLTLSSVLDYKKLAKISKGYSGADVRLVCKEAAMRKVRKIFDVLESSAEGPDSSKLTVDTITTEDVEIALEKTKPSAKLFYSKYEAWQTEFGSI